MAKSQQIETLVRSKFFHGSRLRASVFALLAGTLYPLGFAPLGWWPLTLISVSLLWTLIQHYPRELRWMGLGYGIGQFGVGTSWVYVSIHQFGHASTGLALGLTGLFVLYLALYPMAQLSLLGRLKKKFPQADFGLLFLFCWLLFDGLRGWVFSGFPWLYAGYALTDSGVSGWAPLVGVHGLTLILLVAAIVVSMAARRQPVRLWGTAAAILWFAGYPLGLLAWSTPVSTPVSVSLVQPNVAQDEKWQPGRLWRIVNQLQQQSLTSKADWVIWPEAALPAMEAQLHPHLRPFLEQMQQRKQRIISGVLTQDGQRYFNSVVALEPKAGRQQIYQKRRLVPFGEYVPLEKVLRGLIEFFDLPMSGFSLGKRDPGVFKIKDITLGNAICYEITYPQLVYQQARQSNVLLTVSNDAWFGHSWGPRQHLQMAQMRARETALPILRGTNNGVTAVIGYDGKIKQELAPFVRGRLDTEVQPRSSHAPVMYYHPWWVLLFLLAGLVWASTRYHRVKPDC